MSSLSEAIATIKAGREDEGREMLARILADDSNNLTALLWMTDLAQTPEERREYLGRILAIEPDNALVRRALELLGETHEPSTRIVATQPPTASQTLPEQKPVTEYTSVDQPSPEWQPIVAPPDIPIRQTTRNRKSRSVIRIVLLLAVIVIGGVLAYNYIQTQMYLDRWNRECSGVSEWLQASRDRLITGQQLVGELSQPAPPDTMSSTALVQTMRDGADHLESLESAQRYSQPPIAAQQLNAKWVQFYSFSKTGARMLADAIETETTASRGTAEDMFTQALVALNEGNSLAGSVADQCK